MSVLIIVDVQNDFLPGGSLAVPEGDTIIPIINALTKHFTLVVASKDWHPANHHSFAANHAGKHIGDTIHMHGQSQILWPTHCVQNTHGAQLAPTLDTTPISEVILKGTDPQIDSYSCFFDNGGKHSTGCMEYLMQLNVTQVYIVGLATDYCVKASALDAKRLGFNVFVVEDACKGVNINPDDTRNALEAMRQAGIHIIQTSTIIGNETLESLQS